MADHYEEQLEKMMLREKIENLKIVIKEYSQQLMSEKAKSTGVETVATLLCETQTEMKTVTKQKKSLEAVVRNLQNRLMMNHLPHDVSQEEDDVYIASLCPQTLENLAGQNVRLKNLLHQCASPEQIDDMNKAQDIIDQLKSTITRISQENETLVKEMQQLKNSDNTDNCKNPSIDPAYGKVLSDIQMDLRKFVSECQDLDVKLAKVKDENQFPNNTEAWPVNIENTNLDHEVMDKLKSDMSNLGDENGLLREKLREVSSMNKRWQDYNSQREELIRGLNSQVLEMQTQLAERPEMNVNVSSALKAAHDKIVHLQHVREQAVQEADRAENGVHKLEKELEVKELIIKGLKEERRNIGQTLEGQQDVAVLMAQIQVCTEDFENERRDRVRAQSELTNVRGKFDKMKIELDRYKVLNQTSRLSNNTPYQQGYYRNTGTSSSQREMMEQQLSSRGQQFVDRELMHDGPAMSLNFLQESEKTKPDCKSLPVHSKIEVLCCPKCGKDFSEGEKLLSHIEVCVE